MHVTSSAFSEGERIPDLYAVNGEDLSPPLSWKPAPEGTVELALLCDDPDAPTPQPWVHWIIYEIPGDIVSLPEGVASDEELTSPCSARQGKNSWPDGQTVGYRGPAPPPGHGTHHYRFTLYALNAKLNLPPGADRAALEHAMQGHILAEGRLTGTYSR
jgi:Raf kinase inhibitor-like YbhB/YbcL family protein